MVGQRSWGDAEMAVGRSRRHPARAKRSLRETRLKRAAAFVERGATVVKRAHLRLLLG